MTSDDTLFTTLYTAHHRDVVAYCLRRTNHADAQDAASEVFAVAWRRIGDVPRGDMALPWLYGVARRVISRQYRAKGRLRRLVDRLGSVSLPPVPDPETEIVQRLEYRLVHAALNRLRDQDREIVLLAAWEGLTAAQIGAAVGCSESAAAQRLHRARQRLAGDVRVPKRNEATPVTSEGGEAA